MTGPGIPPGRRDGLHVRGRVLDADLLEPCGLEEPLVYARSGEDEVAHCAAASDHLLTADHPGDRDRVGEEQAATPAHDAMPLTEHALTLVHVIDRVDAKHRVEA